VEKLLNGDRFLTGSEMKKSARQSEGTTEDLTRDPADDLDDLVSVIIPAYNVATFIKEALDSVFAQTYPHYQVIVVNDGSPDTPELEQVLAPYLHRVTYIKQENRGLSGARNTGLRAATGSLVALLDADDIWMPDYLEEQTRFLREHPEYDLVYSNARIFGDTIYDGQEYTDVCPSAGEATPAAIISRRCQVFVSVTARTPALKAVAFDESLRSCEDFDCWIRFTAAGFRIGYHRKILVRCRRHGASLSANRTRMGEYNIQVLTKSLSLWPQDSEEVRLLLQQREKRVAELETTRGKQTLLDEDFSAAIGHFEAANTYYKSAKNSILIFLLRLMPGLVRSFFRLRGLVFRAYRDI
jgi:glycosyltransferase involved in cell wall biosynthesis